MKTTYHCSFLVGIFILVIVGISGCQPADIPATLALAPTASHTITPDATAASLISTVVVSTPAVTLTETPTQIPTPDWAVSHDNLAFHSVFGAFSLDWPPGQAGSAYGCKGRRQLVDWPECADKSIHG